MTHWTGVPGVILAGGQSTRMNGIDKAEVRFDGRRMIDHVYQRMIVQTDNIIISGRSTYGLDAVMIGDEPGMQAGPAAGLYAVAAWLMEKQPYTAFFFTVPVDGPFVPFNLLQRLQTRHGCVVARTRDGLQPTFALWSVDQLMGVFASGIRKGIALRELAAECEASAVDFEDPTPFQNINTPSDLRALGKS